MGYNQKSDLSENIYIIRRRAQAFVHSLAYYMCRIFPIDKKKVVMWTFEGNGGYGCSPKYVAEELLRHNRAYHLSTAGIWLGNTRTVYGTRKRKGQCYIQTWHATLCIKPIGKYRGNLFPKMAYIISKYDSKLIDYVLSGSEWCDHMYHEGLIYDGKIIKTGTPRCDVLVNQRAKKYQQFRKEYNIPADTKILLYAPTFRGGSQSTKRTVNTEESTIDFERLVHTLEKRFGGRWFIFLRLHPQLAAKMETLKTHQISERMIDVSQRPDMNEIIATADVFLTDYSSAIFEANMIGIPGFIYADDLEAYIADRGDLFFDMYKLPFPVALNNDELMKQIEQFDEEKYILKTEQLMKENGIFEDGKASRRVVRLIEKRQRRMKE